MMWAWLYTGQGVGQRSLHQSILRLKGSFSPAEISLIIWEYTTFKLLLSSCMISYSWPFVSLRKRMWNVLSGVEVEILVILLSQP